MYNDIFIDENQVFDKNKLLKLQSTKSILVSDNPLFSYFYIKKKTAGTKQQAEKFELLFEEYKKYLKEKRKIEKIEESIKRKYTSSMWGKSYVKFYKNLTEEEIAFLRAKGYVVERIVGGKYRVYPQGLSPYLTMSVKYDLTTSSGRAKYFAEYGEKAIGALKQLDKETINEYLALVAEGKYKYTQEHEKILRENLIREFSKIYQIPPESIKSVEIYPAKGEVKFFVEDVKSIENNEWVRSYLNRLLSPQQKVTTTYEEPTLYAQTLIPLQGSEKAREIVGNILMFPEKKIQQGINLIGEQAGKAVGELEKRNISLYISFSRQPLLPFLPTTIFFPHVGLSRKEKIVIGKNLNFFSYKLNKEEVKQITSTTIDVVSFITPKISEIRIGTFTTYVVGKAIHPREKPTTLEVVSATLISSSKILSTLPKIRGYISTIGKEYIPAERIVEKEILTGKKMFPTAPPETHLKEFLSGKYKLPTAEKPGGWHATTTSFKRITQAQAGTSELPGLYISPSLSTYFLRIQQQTKYSLKIFPQLKDILKKPAALWIEPKKIVEITKAFRGKERMFMETFAKKGYAYVPMIKTEKEAVITAGTKLIRTGERFYTKISGYRIPIYEYKTVVEGSEKIAKGVEKVEKITSSYYLPTKTREINLYYAIASPSFRKIFEKSYVKYEKYIKPGKYYIPPIKEKYTIERFHYKFKFPIYQGKGYQIKTQKYKPRKMHYKPKIPPIQYPQQIHYPFRPPQIKKEIIPKQFDINLKLYEKNISKIFPAGKQPIRYQPSLTAIMFNIKSRKIIKTLTGFELRPIIKRKKKK